MRFETLKRLQDALACARSGELDALEPGRHELFDGIFVNIARYRTQESGVLEAHRKYIDVHYLIEGSERIAVADVEKLRVTKDYDPDTDCLLGVADGKSYLLKKGEMLVLFPEEAHLPGLIAGEAAEVKKAVLKVPVE